MKPPKVLDKNEIAWAAGLFEGEGSIGARKSTGNVKLQLAMTDEDVLRRFQLATGLGKVYGPYLNGKRQDGTPKKNYWQWHLDGFEQSQALLAMFWPWLGVRRRARASEILLAVPRYQKQVRKIIKGKAVWVASTDGA